MIRATILVERRDFALDLDFQTESQVTGIFGPSGAGKTTLVNAIAGLERPTRGCIRFGETTLFDDHQKIDVPIHKRQVGMVFQEHRLFPNYSVGGNLRYGSPRWSQDYLRIVDLLELEKLISRRIHELSGGERQRVALGRALLSHPRLLLLDEPLASLDQRLRQQIIPYLRRVRDELNVPMLYVSHDLTEIMQLTDQILVLENGKAVGQGKYANIVHDDAVLSVVHDRGMNNVIPARVLSHQPDEGVTLLEVGSEAQSGRPATSQLVAPLCAAKAGTQVLISIRPWDVALAKDPVHGVSIQNQVRGMVTRCTNHVRSTLVDVDIGLRITVEISRRAAASLGVIAGQPIVCLIKTRAIQYMGLS